MKKLFFYSSLLALLSACSKESTNVPSSTVSYTDGFFLLNEGAFSGGTATLNFYKNQGGTPSLDIFQQVNNRPIGNVGQDLEKAGDYYYISVNNAQKIEITDQKMTSVKTITGFSLPDQILAVEPNKVYVTEWVNFGGNGNLVVVDGQTRTISKRIPLGNTPSALYYFSGKLWVCNSNGNTISVINTETNTLEKTIPVGDWPNSMVQDENGKIWVLCSGKPSYTGSETAGRLVRVNTQTGVVESVKSVFNLTDHPADLKILGGSTLVFGINGEKVVTMKTSDNTFSNPKISRGYYKMHVNPKGDKLYVTDAGDYVSKGKVYIYATSTFSLLDSLQGGIVPRDILFN